MQVITPITVEYAVLLNKNGVENSEEACAQARARSAFLMKAAFEGRLGMEVDTVRAAQRILLQHMLAWPGGTAGAVRSWSTG